MAVKPKKARSTSAAACIASCEVLFLPSGQYHLRGMHSCQGQGVGEAAGQTHLKDGHRLGEVVLLHGGGGVQRCQGVVKFLQVAVTEAPVVQVMAQTCN